MTFLIRMYIEPRDVWVGMYFKKFHALDVYICPVPCVVIRITRVKMKDA